ncbi:hypothetical protein IWQ61_008393, partial [Dispira simplex]
HIAQSSTTAKNLKDAALSGLKSTRHDSASQLSPPLSKLMRRHPGDAPDVIPLDTSDRDSSSTFSATSTNGWVIVIAVVFSTLFVVLAVIRCLFLLRKTRWARNHGFGFPEYHNRTTLTGAPFDHLGEQGDNDYFLTDEMVRRFPVIQLDEKNIDHICDFNFSTLGAVEGTKMELCSSPSSGSFQSEKNLTPIVSTVMKDRSDEGIREKDVMGVLMDQPNEKVRFQDRIKEDKTPPSSIASSVASDENKVEPMTLPSNTVNTPQVLKFPPGHDFTVTSKYTVEPPEKTIRQGENHSSASVTSTVSSCSICLDEFSLGELIRILPCHHHFHAHCIDLWLKSRHSHCPLCKFNCYFYLKDHYPELFPPPPSSPSPHASTSRTFSSILGHSDNFSRYPPWLLFRRPQFPANAVMYGGGFRAAHPILPIPPSNRSLENRIRPQDSTFVTVETASTRDSPGQPSTMSGEVLG